MDIYFDNSRHKKTSRRADAAEQSDAPEIEEASQRVGLLAEIPSLLRDLGVDPAEVQASAGLDTEALDILENRIPYVASEFATAAGASNRKSYLGCSMPFSQRSFKGPV